MLVFIKATHTGEVKMDIAQIVFGMFCILAFCLAVSRA